MAQKPDRAKCLPLSHGQLNYNYNLFHNRLFAYGNAELSSSPGIGSDNLPCNNLFSPAKPGLSL